MRRWFFALVLRLMPFVTPGAFPATGGTDLPVKAQFEKTP
jgi:hypothetical protein